MIWRTEAFGGEVRVEPRLARGQGPGAYDLRVAEEARDEDTALYRIAVRRKDGRPFSFRGVAVQIEHPAVDIHGLWSPFCPEGDLRRLPWRYERLVAANASMPVVAFVNRRGMNRLLVGLLDQTVETRVEARLDETRASVGVRFERPVAGITRTCEEAVEHLHLSRKGVPWFEAVRAYARRHDSLLGAPAVQVPEAAYDPVFCSWYAIHHDVNQRWVLATAREMVACGFGTFIIDDGWFFEGPGRMGDYSRTGDWRVSAAKFPDLRGMVEELREIGVRTLLWIAPFMVGKDSEAWGDLAGLLSGPVRMGVRSLCPRSLRAHERIITTLVRLMETYGLDGFKVDFLDSVGREPCREGHRHDFETMGEGIVACLAGISGTLWNIRRDVLLEFRQHYATLAMRRFATMFRALDAPCDFDTNRWEVVMTRSFAEGIPVHFDPAYWHPGEGGENVARHMISSLFSVPMLSVDWRTLPADHHRIVKGWMGFYGRHRRTLARGEFAPVLVDGRIVALTLAEGEAARGGVCAGVGGAVRLGGGVREAYLLNASNSGILRIRADLLSGGEVGRTALEVWVSDGSFSERRAEEEGGPSREGFGLRAVPVPLGGYVRLRRG